MRVAVCHGETHPGFWWLFLQNDAELPFLGETRTLLSCVVLNLWTPWETPQIQGKKVA